MEKGPSLFGANLGSTMFCFRICTSSHTLSPMLKGVNFDWIWFFIIFQAHLWASSQDLTIVFRCSSAAGSCDWSIREGST